MPHIPGSDAAGVVDEVGDGVSRFEPGDRVAVLAGKSGGGDEFVARVPDTRTGLPHHRRARLRCPQRVRRRAGGESRPRPRGRRLGDSRRIAAGVPDRLADAARPRRPEGRRVGTGARCVRRCGPRRRPVADHADADSFGTASTQEKLDLASDLGLDHGINYEETDFRERRSGQTDGRGVDMVVDHIGAETYQDSLKSLRKGGRIVTCGATTGPNPNAGLNRIFWKQLSVIGSTMATPGQADEVLDLVWQGEMDAASPRDAADERNRHGHTRSSRTVKASRSRGRSRQRDQQVRPSLSSLSAPNRAVATPRRALENASASNALIGGCVAN